MGAVDLTRALEVATAAAREAGSILIADFHRSGGPRGAVDKAAADLEAENAIRARLGGAFPDWSYLGEETGRSPGRHGYPVWLVDPNDGTRDYLEGRRGSAVSIGLVAQGQPVLGVVLAFGYPDDGGTLFAWADGLGPIRREGSPVEAALPSRLDPKDVILVSSKGDRDPDGQLACAAPARYRSVVSIAHRLALVASGEAAAATSIYAPVAWDYAAGHALLRGLGATLLDENGREVVYTAEGDSQSRMLFAGSREVAEEIRRRPWGDVDTTRPHPFASPRKGEAVADAGLLSRAQGCLLGQVAGDSLGGLVEFSSASEVQRRYPDGPRELEDGGFWNILAGQPTDDSELALALARAILRRGRYDPQAVLAAYRAWQQSEPFDMGGTIRAALADRANPASQANGSLMRASPLAIFVHSLPLEDAVDLARQDSRLTHPNPVCGDAVAAFVVAVRHALREGDGPEAAWRAALDWARGSGAALSVVEALESSREGPPDCDTETPGFVLVALQNAFHEVWRGASVEQGVVATVRRGGDTDTNAAIAGALLGAVYGREAVPSQWRRMVLSCRPHPSRAKRPRPMEYWPIDVLVLAERLLLIGATVS
jgi:ADP-ribosylglycohydrolase/fructose-1,6-bisphosphatase/inositol monophosphatase family enzyme